MTNLPTIDDIGEQASDIFSAFEPEEVGEADHRIFRILIEQFFDARIDTIVSYYAKKQNVLDRKLIRATKSLLKTYCESSGSSVETPSDTVQMYVVDAVIDIVSFVFDDYRLEYPDMSKDTLCGTVTNILEESISIAGWKNLF